MLVEGSSLKATARVTGTSKNTVTRLLSLAGNYCADYHNTHVKELRPRSIQCDEMWAYVYCRSASVSKAKAAPSYAGDLWTWIALDADSRLIISCYFGGHATSDAEAFIFDLRSRIASDHRAQIITDGLSAYFWPIAKNFPNVNYARAYKIPNHDSGLYTIQKQVVIGSPDHDSIHTNYIERFNKTLRMDMKRYGRKVDAFSKNLTKHRQAAALHTVYYNYIRPHQTLSRGGIPITPAMAAGLTDRLFTIERLAQSIPR